MCFKKEKCQRLKLSRHANQLACPVRLYHFVPQEVIVSFCRLSSSKSSSKESVFLSCLAPGALVLTHPVLLEEILDVSQ